VRRLAVALLSLVALILAVPLAAEAQTADDFAH
jgi:hypothetical protein